MEHPKRKINFSRRFKFEILFKVGVLPGITDTGITTLFDHIGNFAEKQVKFSRNEEQSSVK